ncbi:MAG: hypothetical protein Q8O47_06500, partial [Candidatus Bathyarchaeota archaeon]|nr:hypothetical protein [Candidatus Bathyarchaeota archaeon]
GDEGARRALCEEGEVGRGAAGVYGDLLPDPPDDVRVAEAEEVVLLVADTLKRVILYWVFYDLDFWVLASPVWVLSAILLGRFQALQV